MKHFKKNSSMILNIISVSLITISIGSVTSRGIMEGYSTYYKTISFNDKPWHTTIKMYQDGVRLSSPILNILFFMALGLLILSALLFYKKEKNKSICLTIMNLLGTTFSFLMFQNGSYLLMTGAVSTMVMLQIVLQSTCHGNKLISAITSTLSICIWMISVYFLIKQFTLTIGIWDISDILLDDLIKISRINVICIILYIIPCILSIICNIKKSNMDFLVLL